MRTGGAEGAVTYEWMAGGWAYPGGGGYESTMTRADA